MRRITLPALRHLWIALAVSSALSLAPVPLMAAPAIGVPMQPVLRVETGSHMGPINAIASDARGAYIVTASDDKTARVWDATTGRLLQVLRPPIGEESLGTLYAVALSPDGSTVAVAGNSSFDGNSHAVYLFDRATGAIRNRGTILGMEAPVLKLAWSPDGRHLAIGLRQQGIRLFRTSPELGFVDKDVEYNEGVSGLDFSRDGRLLAAGRDGFIRVYQTGGRELKRSRRQLPAMPASAVFSPNGQLIAVAYQDRPQIDVLDANTLEVRYSTGYGSNGNLGRLAWSGDGRTLYAGGTASRSGRFPLLAFRDGGQGSGEELQSFGDAILALAPLPNGGVLAGTGEPSWLALDGRGSQRALQTRLTADFRDAGSRFLVSADGRQLAFPTRNGGRDMMSFDLAKGTLLPGEQGNLNAPREPGWGSGLEGWKNGRNPQLNGRPLPLAQGEISRSVAFAGNGSFVLGSDWFVRGFDTGGRLLWERRTPATAWAVNVSGDGKWAIAGLADGSIRWYRMGDGQEQLALFPHLDRERWLVWTPPGYYDASVGGEALVGWQVNRAFNRQSDFFSVGRFRKQFFRPDVIQRVLPMQGVAPALQAANAASASIGMSSPPPATDFASGSAMTLPAEPPVLEMQTDREVQASGTQLPLRFAVRAPADAPATEVKVRVNGKLVRSINNLPRPRGGEAAMNEVVVPLPPNQDAEVVVLASNRNGLSDPTIIHVRRPAAPAGSSEPVSKFKKLYLLAVGVAKYPNLPPDNQLQYPDKDATEFAEMFRRHASNLYEEAQIRVVTNEKATRQAVLEGLRWIRDNVGPDDMGIVFLAGHGFLLPKGNTYIYAPSDLAKNNLDGTGVPGSAIQDVIANLRGRGIFFMDTCHSGFAINALSVQNNINGLLNQAEDERGVTVISGAGGNQEALESDSWRNGAFTYAIKEGVLQRKADIEHDGKITPLLLYRFIKKKMGEMTRDTEVERKPVPKYIGASFDEPFIVVK